MPVRRECSARAVTSIRAVTETEHLQSSEKWRSVSSVQFPLHLVERIEKAMGGHGRAHQEKPEHVPVEHMPVGGELPLDPQLLRLRPQLLGDPRHPDQRIEKQRRDAQQIGHRVALGAMAQDLVQLILQAAPHIDEEEQPRREKVDKAQQEAGPPGMLKSHGIHLMLSIP